jgi:hypothetical protein
MKQQRRELMSVPSPDGSLHDKIFGDVNGRRFFLEGVKRQQWNLSVVY